MKVCPNSLLGASASLLLIISSQSLVLAQSTNVEVEIDASVRHQTVEGWGTSLITWSYNQVPYWREDWRAAYRDLGVNVIRVNLKKEVLVHSNNDWATPVRLGSDLQENVDRMDFTIDAVRVFGDLAAWLAENALEPERVKIIGAVWSPPHWMKGPTGSEIAHITAGEAQPVPYLHRGMTGDSVGGRLLQDEDNLEQFGRYLAAWVTAWEQEYGVPMYAISLQNEVAYENPFDSCTYLRGPNGEEEQYWQYTSALKAVKDVWEQYPEVTTKVMGPHFANIKDTPEDPWGLNTQMRLIQAVREHSDPGLLDFMSIYTNNYGTRFEDVEAKMWRAYWEGKETQPELDWDPTALINGIGQDGKQLWNSETGGNRSGWDEDRGALQHAREIHDFLVWGQGSAWIHWQMSDLRSEESSHTLLGLSNIADPHQSWKYCAYKHFSRYIRPGAKRINAHFQDGHSTFGPEDPMLTHEGLNVSAFVHEEDATVTIVFVNMRSESYSVEIAVPANPMVESFAVFETDGTDRFDSKNDRTVRNGTIRLSVPAKSAVTLFGEGTRLSGYEGFRQTYWPWEENGSLIDPQADPDGDKAPNLLEYALGLDPTTANSKIQMPQVSVSENELSLTYYRNADLTDIAYIIESTTDFENWTEEYRSTEDTFTTGETEWKTALAGGKQFLRLRIEQLQN